MAKTPQQQDYRQQGTLYFFPAFIPLVQFVPWVLAAVGAVAGLAGFSGRNTWRMHRRKIVAISLLLLAAAGGVYYFTLPGEEVRAVGTHLITPEKHYSPTVHASPEPFTPPPVAGEFQEIKRIRANKQILSTPVITKSLIVFGTLDNSVEAFSRQTGKHVWTLPQRNPVFTLSQTQKGDVIAGDGQHYTTAALLTRFDANSGKTLWSREFMGHIEELPMMDEENDRLWTGAGPGGLWSIRISDGGLLWHQPIGHIDAKPLLLNNVIYAPAQLSEDKQESAFFAVDAEDGSKLWQLPLPGQPWGSPVADKTGEIILSSTGSGQIGITRHTDKGWAQAISPEGKLLWQTELPGMPLQPSVYIPEENLIIHSLKSGEVVALHVKDGTFAWRAGVGAELQAPGTLLHVGGHILFASVSYDGQLTIRNAKNGEEMVRQRVDAYSTASPVADGDLLYVPGAWDIVVFSGLNSLKDRL